MIGGKARIAGEGIIFIPFFVLYCSEWKLHGDWHMFHSCRLISVSGSQRPVMICFLKVFHSIAKSMKYNPIRPSVINDMELI
jgi:hypothetical protein